MLKGHLLQRDQACSFESIKSKISNSITVRVNDSQMPIIKDSIHFLIQQHVLLKAGGSTLFPSALPAGHTHVLTIKMNICLRKIHNFTQTILFPHISYSHLHWVRLTPEHFKKKTDSF